MWSRLEDTELWDLARSAYETPDGRLYHVFDHPLRLYELAETLNMPYNEDLDLAILLHDVIYNGKPDDVRKSADFLLKHRPDAVKAADLIMSTETHEPCADNRLIILDLYDISDPTLRNKNRELIADELSNLKGTSRDAFYAGNNEFMSDLRNRIIEGVGSTNVSRDDIEHFSVIVKGIRDGIEEVRALMSSSDIRPE